MDEIKKSLLFGVQLDESTDVSMFSQLLVLAQYMLDGDTRKNSSFVRLNTTTRAQDLLEIVNNFFEAKGLDWENLVGVTSDGAPAMLGSRSGFQAVCSIDNWYSLFYSQRGINIRTLLDH